MTRRRPRANPTPLRLRAGPQLATSTHPRWPRRAVRPATDRPPRRRRPRWTTRPSPSRRRATSTFASSPCAGGPPPPSPLPPPLPIRRHRPPPRRLLLLRLRRRRRRRRRPTQSRLTVSGRHGQRLGRPRGGRGAARRARQRAQAHHARGRHHRRCVSSPPSPFVCEPAPSLPARARLARLTGSPPSFPRTEGSWDEVMAVVGKAHTVVHRRNVLRVQSSMRVGTR